MRIVALAAFLAASVVALTAAGPGTGTAIISPSSPVAAGSSGKWSVTYTAAEVHDNGTLRLTIASGWTAPQNSSAMSPGFVTVTTDEPTGVPSVSSIVGQAITIAVDTLNVGNTITVVYGDDTISALGRASAATTVGSYSFLIASDPSGSSPSPIVTSPSLNVIPTTPASLDIVPNDTTGVAAGSFIQLNIRVLDTFGNRAPVSTNRTISLFATHGSFYDPANHSTPITSAVIASGTNVKRVDYRPTLVAGSPHTLNVFTASGSPSLGGSTFVSVVPGALSAAQSGVGANTPVVADGSSQSTVVVTSRDAFGNVRAGDTVTIAVTGSAIDIDPPLPTNAGGQTSGVVTDTVAETVNVSASINGTPLTSGTAPVTFVAGPVSAATSIVDATTGIIANGAAASTITITARDAHNNLIQGQPVSLSVLPTTGTSLTQPGGVTGPNGQITGTLACTNVGLRTVSASIGGVPVTDTAPIDFVAGPVTSFNVVVDGNAVAGTVDPVTITARDALGHAVTNYTGTVNLTSTSTGSNTVEWALGDGQGTISNTPGSNNGTYTFVLADLGQAIIRIIDNKVETITVTADAGGPTGTSGNLVVAPNFADKIEVISGGGQTATVATSVASPPTVRVVDAFNNPVPGATVTFTAVQGAGSVDAVSGGAPNDSTAITGSDGRIDCDIWRMGNIAGPNRLRARIASGTTTFVYFSATGTAGVGANLDITPNSQPVTQGTSLVVTAALTDQFGNAKSGDVVTIAITDSPDGTLSSNGADPNPTSTINAFTRSGTTDAAGRITVLFNAPGSAPLSDVVDASSGAVTQGSVVNSVYTTTASGATSLRVTFVGPSTKPANQTYQFLVEAIDGNNNVDATNTSTVTLTPEAGGNLAFSLTDFGSTVTSVALVAGARTVYGRGTVAGDWDITASTLSGLGSDTKVVTITDTGVIDHYAVSTVASIAAGVLFDVTVEARDVFDNLVVGATNAVTLEAYDDVANSPALASLLDPSATLAGGRVTVAETYTKAEPIRVRANAGGKIGFSGIVTVSAAGAYRIAKISGDASGIIAGATQVLTTQVLDAFDNPVNGAVVSFTVLTGGGSPSQPTATTNPSGQASITLTTGNTVGSNTVKATIDDENPPSLERVDYLVTTVPGPVASFTVTPASYSLVAGTGVALNVTGFDTHSNLVTNDSATPIQLTNTGVAQFGAATGTLVAGQFNTTVVDTLAQSFTITATRQGGGATGTSSALTVSNSGAYRVTKVSGDASGVTAGTARTLDVLVRDNHSNPVPNALVTFATTGAINDGTFIDAVGDPNDGITTTDGTGHATISFTTSLTAGANAVNAQILDGTPVGRERVSFTVNTVAGGIAYYTVQMSGTTAVAGTARNATITAFDINDNPVDDDVTQVTLSGDPGTGLVFGTNPVTLTNGVATTTVTANTVQTYKVRAGLPGPTGLGPDVTVTPAAPAGVITGTPAPATITANNVSTSTITSSVITDAFGNQVPVGTQINVSTNAGTIVPAGAKFVAANGRISFDLRSSSTPGTATVTMTSQLGTATGTTNVAFAPPPAFVATNLQPNIVAPGDNVSFQVDVQNTSTTDATTLTTATNLTFSDGTRTFTANLPSPATIVGPGTQTLTFVTTTVNAAFTPGQYAPNVVLVGTDEFSAPINTTVSTPTNSLLVTSIQITAITAPAIVSRGQTPTVTVSVKNNGAQTTHISDIDLVFAPGTGNFTPGPITPKDVLAGATEQFNISVFVDPSCPVNPYTIDAVATGDVGGKTVTDNSLAPFSLPSWQIIAAANLSYVAGSMTPMTVSRGASYQFRATIANGGAGVVSLDSSVTTIQFTDGTRTYQAKPSQPYAIAGSSQQQIVFKVRSVPAAFTIGAYAASFHMQGLESGAPFLQDINSGADQIAVQTPANPTPGSVLPDQVSKGSSVSFTVQVNNAGGATVVLTPASTKFRFASNAFTADLSATGSTTLPPGTTTLTFQSTTVSGSITAGTYAGQLVLVGTENGNAFSRTQATENVVVVDAPDIQILADTPSQSPITADQTKSLKVRMVVKNNGGAAVTFTDASIKFIQAGQDRSGQFNISTPTGFTLGGSTLNGGGAADTVTFNVSDNTGNAMTAGMMTVQGFLDVKDVNTNQPILAERELGDFLQVQSPGTITVLAVLPSRSLVTQNMARDFMVRAVVQNTGQSDIAMTLTGPLRATVAFAPAAGWVTNVRSQLGHGGNLLSGGEVDTVLFDVTTSGSTTGNALINTNLPGVEVNSNRALTGASSGSASVLVQSPGVIAVTSVVSSRSTITRGANVPWTLTVTLQNTGESDVDLALGNAIGVVFENSLVAPVLTRPSVLAGGGTVLSGGETDQIVIGMASAGTYSSAGNKTVTATFDGTEINSNAPKSGNNNTTVTVQDAPVLNVVSVNPATVSRGSNVGFQVTVTNAAPAATGATATLDRLTTRLNFGSGNFDVNLLAGSPVDVVAGQQVTLLLTPAVVVPAIPIGVQNDATLEFRWSENGRTGSEDETMNTPPKRITVQNAPALNILSVRTSWQNATVAQTNPGVVTMVLRNSNGADVDLDLTPAATRLQLNMLGTGALVTPEYSIVPPAALVGGGIRLSSGETDSLLFNVTQAGDTPGNVIVSGFVAGTDVTSSLPVSDNTGDGGSGSFVLQTAGVLDIVKITPQRPTATVGQTGAGADYTIKIAVRNDGQAAIDLDLAAPTTTALDFGGTPGWITTLQTSLVGGGLTLSGGETDTVVFNVTRTGNTPGSQLIFGSVTGTEINRNVLVSDDASSGGWGTITLQAQAALDILSVTPSRASLTSGASTPWDITVVVRNTGESSARLVLPAGLTMTIQSAPGATFDPVNFLEEGGVVLAGGDTGTLVVHGATSPTFSAFGSRTIGASLNAVELNSSRAFNRNETIGSVIAQTDPNLTVALIVTPTIVTRGTQALLQVDVTNPGANAATVDLDRGNTRVSFGFGQYSAYLQPGSPTQILAGQTAHLSFEDKLVPTALTAGPYNLTVDLAYTANNFDKTEVETITNGITVQDPPSFSITGIAASQGSATAGQTMPWFATMTIHNDGATPIDVSFASNKTYIQFVVPGGGFDTNYIVTQPTSMVGGATQLGPGATGQIEFNVTKTGNTTGVIVISGRVEGTDGAAIVSDDTFDGGRGSISVVPAASITVLSTHTSQALVTQSQGADWTARVVVANTGGADVDLNLATSHIDFAGPQAGWSIGTPILAGGGSTLEGGSVDSLLFTVLTTGSSVGAHRIDATVPWQDVNTSAIDSAVTTSSGFGSITVETPVAIRITTTTSQSPNPAAVNRGQAFDVRIQVQNTGQADARDVAIAMSRSGSSTILPIAPITEVIGGQTVTYDLGVVAANASNPAETFTTSITSATDENSGAAVTPLAPGDNSALVAIQSPAVLEIQNVHPSQATVTRGQTTPFWSVIARVHNNGESGTVLTPPAANDLSFSIGGSNQTDFVVQPPTAFGSGATGWTLAGSAIDSLIYTVTVTGAGTGTVDIGVAADGTDRNDPTLSVNDANGTSVQVQAPAGLAITTTLPVGTVNHASADRDTVNTSFAYEIHVTVDNTGGEAVDSVLVQLTSDLGASTRSTIAPASLRRQQIGIAGSHTFIYRITAPVNPVTLETFTSTILAGAKSHNTGLPVTPQPPADNRHVVVTQRPANLIMDLTSASGAVSTNQVFTMSATVTNSGQAGVSGTAEMTLTLPAGFALQNPGAEPALRTFVVGTAVTWQVVAPGTAQSAQMTSAMTTTPNDRNIGTAAASSQPSDAFAINVVSGGAFTSPTLAIATPAGAVDGTVSAGQTLSMGASVAANATTGSIIATLSVPAGFSIVGSPTRNLGTGTGAPVSVSPAFSMIAPANAGTGDVFVTFTGTDINTSQPVPSGADTVLVTTVARAALTANALVTAPPEATDNKVTIGTTFVVTASVANAPLAAGIASPGALSIGLPAGYTLAGGTVSQPFTIPGTVVWQVNAPSQPSGPDQINVTISTTPPDENSGLAALIVNGTASIAMVTEGSAVAVRDVSQSLGINVGPVPAGASNIRLLGFEIAYNVSDASVNDARIDTIAVTIVGKDGTALGPGTVAATLSRLSIDLGGATPYEVVDPSTNPVIVSLLAGGADRTIAPDASRNAIVSISLDGSPSAKELSVGLRNGGLAVRDAGSGQKLGVTDSQGRPLDGVITSAPLVVLSSNFEEYAHNYPNPFRAGSQDTRIAYFLASAGNVSISIYALDGDLVYEENIPSSDSRAQAGPQEATWDGRNGQGEVVRNGVYVCVLNAGGQTAKFRIAVAK